MNDWLNDTHLDFLIQIIGSPLIGLLLALALARWLPIQRQFHPLAFFEVLLQRLAKKVHPDINRAPQQQTLSGFLALIIMVTLPCVMIYLFKFLLEVPQLLDVLILWVLFDWFNLTSSVKRIARALEKDQKKLARERAQLWLLRDTSALSNMGINKALCESLALRLRDHLTVVVMFLLLGIEAALCVSIIRMCSQQWSCKVLHFRYFGLWPKRLTTVVTFIPGWLLAKTFTLYRRGSLTTQPYQGYWPKITATILFVMANLSQTRLGGPADYQGTRVRRPAILDSGETATPHSLEFVMSVCQRAHSLWLVTLVLIYTGYLIVLWWPN